MLLVITPNYFHVPPNMEIWSVCGYLHTEFYSLIFDNQTKYPEYKSIRLIGLCLHICLNILTIFNAGTECIVYINKLFIHNFFSSSFPLFQRLESLMGSNSSIQFNSSWGGIECLLQNATRVLNVSVFPHTEHWILISVSKRLHSKPLHEQFQLCHMCQNFASLWYVRIKQGLFSFLTKKWETAGYCARYVHVMTDKSL
jgi:hypothetical protein